MTKTRKKRDPLKPKSSTYNGVSLHPVSKKYIAQYKHNKKTTYLGSFTHEITAAIKYDTAIYAQMQAGNITMDLTRLNFGIPNSPEAQDKIEMSAAIDDLLREEIIASNSPPPTPPAPKKITHTSQYKGVSWYSAREYWKVSIQINKHKTYIGQYNTEEEAARAYNEKIRTAAEIEPDANKRINLLKRRYEVPETETFYPKDYIKATAAKKTRKPRKTKLEPKEEIYFIDREDSIDSIFALLDQDINQQNNTSPPLLFSFDSPIKFFESDSDNEFSPKRMRQT